MDSVLNLFNTPFDLGYTLDSGQVFRWVQRDGWWLGVLPDGVVRLRQEGSSLVFSSSSEGLNSQFLSSYFRLGDDLQAIFSSIIKDKLTTDAVQRFYGLRLIRQDVWECLVSFVMATNTNIPRIRLMTSRLCDKFGHETSFEGLPYRLFPRPESLAAATVEELIDCGLGYRARFVKAVAETVYSETIDLEELRLLDYTRARDLLLQKVLGKKTLLGIGRKVADCVLLFSCEKDSAFPIDIWMARVLAKHYPEVLGDEIVRRLNSHVSRESHLSAGDYDKISDAMRAYFGQHAGYAQQYLYHYARTEE